jgi:hypothetical protein
MNDYVVDVDSNCESFSEFKDKSQRKVQYDHMKTVKGFVVQFPLNFLKNEKLAGEVSITSKESWLATNLWV